LGIALQEGEEFFGILEAAGGHGTHWERTMVEADQGMIAWRLLQRLLQGGEFSVAEVPMALPRYLRVEEYDLPRLPDHTACEVNRPALEVGVHLCEDVMIARDTIHREPQRREQAAEPLIGHRRPILGEIAGCDEQVRCPGIALHHSQEALEGGKRVD